MVAHVYMVHADIMAIRLNAIVLKVTAVTLVK